MSESALRKKLGRDKNFLARSYAIIVRVRIRIKCTAHASASVARVLWVAVERAE